MKPSFVNFPLRLIEPSFNSPLTKVVLELERLRYLQLGGDTPRSIFRQIKEIFHLLESLGSARIEGNHTTLEEYVEAKISPPSNPAESIWEIRNIEEAINFTEDAINPGDPITHQFIRELHSLTVRGLEREGDKTPGSYSYRTFPVKIGGSGHAPPEHVSVQSYMEELIAFINKTDAPQFDLLKTAIAHHRFAWIHPFGNGNGRVVRLLTYALLIKYGFKVKTGRVLNPTAVFCNDRNRYYAMLAGADAGTTEGLTDWSIYVLAGIQEELKKVERLMDYEFLKKGVLFPALNHSLERKIITPDESIVLRLAIEKGSFRANDLDGKFPKLNPRQRSYLIKKLVDNRMIRRGQANYAYTINFSESLLLRSVMKELVDQGFAPSLDKRS